MVQPLVSIIIPAYNHGLYIENCLDSIVNQTYENIELIILNDGSEDDTHQKIVSYESKLSNRFTRYQYIDKKNEGICRTLNKGLRMAQGKYIIPLGSDDVMFPKRVEIQVAFLEKHTELGMVYANGYHLESEEYLDPNNHNGEGLLFSEKMEMYSISDTNEYLSYPNGSKEFQMDSFRFMLHNIFLIHSTGICIRKECYDKVGLYDEDLSSEDLDMAIRMAKVYKYGFIKEPLVIHRLHPFNTGRSLLMIDTLNSLVTKYKNSPLLNEEEKGILLLNIEKNMGYLDITRIEAEMRDKKIIVWGTGSSYERLKGDHNLEVDFFIDSNPEKQGKMVDGKLVYPPSKLLEIKRENYYVIVASEFYRQIYYELQKMGYLFRENFV